jgi:hypothetical protein
MISKNRGKASEVKSQNDRLDAPLSTTNSKKRKDCVKKTTAVKTNVIKTVAISRFLKR